MSKLTHLHGLLFAYSFERSYVIEFLSVYDCLKLCSFYSW